MEKRYRDLEKYLLKNFQLIANGSNKLIFKNGDKVFKLAKNKLGLDSNMNELILQSKSEFFNKTRSIERDLLIEADFIDLSKCKKVYDFCNFEKNESIINLDIHYLLNNNRFINRGIPEEQLNNFKQNKKIKKNKYYKSILDLCIKYNLEPANLVHSSYVLNDKLIIIDFGLTEKNYFNNMKRVVIKVPSPNIAISTLLIKGFDNNFHAVLDAEKLFEPIDFNSFCKFFIGEENKISDEKYYNLNNVALFDLTEFMKDRIRLE